MLKAIIYFSLTLCIFAGKPSWKTYAVYIDGIKSENEVKSIEKAIISTDPKTVKEVKGLNATSGYALIYHDHHNVTIQKIAQNILKTGKYKIYTKLHIPDYLKVQGTLVGDRLNEIINKEGRGYTIKTIDSKKGLFEVIMHAGSYQGKGFNFGDLAHPISDPVVYGGLGLNMEFIGAGDKNAGAMKKNANEKELRFRKTGKKMKKYSPELMVAYKKLFNFPSKELKKYYK